MAKSTIGVHVTITKPTEQGYAWKEAITNYLQFADQVVVVDGGSTLEELKWITMQSSKIKLVTLDWPEKWHWSELPKHNQLGLESLDTDWAMRMDIDYLIHESDHANLKFVLNKLSKENWLLASLTKKVILNRHKYYKKCDLPIIINKDRAGTAIAYGYDPKIDSDWCFPILRKKQDEKGVWTGTTMDERMIYRTGINCWDYDYFFRNKEKVQERFWAFSQAWYTATGKWSWGNNPEEAFIVFCKQGMGRLSKQIYDIAMEGHPAAIRERVSSMGIGEWGYNNFNNLENIKL